MDLQKLRQCIRELALLEETASPVISCYLNLESGAVSAFHMAEARARLIQRSLSGEERYDFDLAFARIEDFIRPGLLPEIKGAAIFARAGVKPFFLPLQFQVGLPNWLTVNSTPNIYHLVELKDTYHRYVVLISTEESARILEVNLGAVTAELWKDRPELRKRVGREWTKEHYLNHRRDRAGQFIKEKIQILERLMSAGGHTHLMLAGNPRISARVRQALPRPMAAKLVDTVAAASGDRASDVVAATISAFVEQEEMESRALVERLQREINTGGLAVAGTQETLQSLRQSQVDVLVMAKQYEPEPGWMCNDCGSSGLVPQGLAVCSSCGERDLRPLDLKEEMVRLASQNGRHIEVVNHSDFLMQAGGVGALLRYLSPEQYLRAPLAHAA